MIKKILMLSIGLTFGYSLKAQNAYFSTHPAPNPDGTQVYFAYQGDIWVTETKGGTARRVTAMPGDESHPRVSPDGKWLAFNGAQDGNPNIYVMRIDGGDIRQLTYHDGADLMSSWSWDSEQLYFSSNRYNRVSTYQVSLAGGTPKRLFGHYFNIPHDLLENPLNKEQYFFTDSWESYNQASRKRYKGAFNPDIKSYDVKKDSYEQLTNYEGKDMWPSFSKAGQLYFASDEVNEEMNLYTLEQGKKVALTNFKTAIRNPQVNANGQVVVFEKDYQLFAYYPADKSTKEIPISISSANALETSQTFNTSGNISHYDISPDGKKIAFVSRGLLFVTDIKGKFTQRIPTPLHERVQEVNWLEDNKTLIFNQTNKGWRNLYTAAADGKGIPKQITSQEQHDRDLVMSADRKLMAFYSGRNDVKVINLTDLKVQTVASDELWGFQNNPAHFSPDNKFLAFNSTRNFEKEIIIVNLETKQITNLTHTMVSENSPHFSADGQYIYFSTDRTQPSYPTGATSPKIYRIPLIKLMEPFKSDEFEKLFEDEGLDKKGDKISVNIDFKDIEKRWEQVTTAGNSQVSPFTIVKDGKHTVLYNSNQDGAGFTLWKTEIAPFENNKTEKFKGTRGSINNIVAAKSNIYGLMGGDINQLKVDAGTVEKISIDYRFEKNLRAEFEQMFYETWANIAENFYDKDFHGIDWKAIKKAYEVHLPKVTNRSDLRVLTNQMLGEINASHMGFNSSGREESSYYRQRTAMLGIVFQTDKPYTVDYIIKNGPLDYPNNTIKSGDILTEINGQKIDSKVNMYQYLTSADISPELTLTFSDGKNSKMVKIHPISTGAYSNLLYDEWMDANQAKVDELSNQKIAYIHMKNMSGGELERFLIEMANEAQYKDGLILDLRNNTGGNVHDKVLQTLSQKTYANWQYREGNPTSQPNFTPSDKPIVLLINEQSLSDAEVTAAGFKALKLGTIMGKETYRWIIFTSAFGLVDGSSHRMPAWGLYDLEGNDLELTGVQPDIEVDQTFKDRLKGNDPQIEEAVKLILKQMN